MPYTGLLMLLFIVFPIWLISHFADKSTRTISEIVSQAFPNPVVVFMYVAAMAVAVIQASVTDLERFQTIGASHPKYMPTTDAAFHCIQHSDRCGIRTYSDLHVVHCLERDHKLMKLDAKFRADRSNRNGTNTVLN